MRVNEMRVNQMVSVYNLASKTDVNTCTHS